MQAGSHDTAPRIVETADGRLVGYRRLGEGPPVVLLHASPRSSAALLPLAERLAHRFTVFAFDTPGFGFSDPLRIDRPDAWDFADALIGAFDALGIARAAIHGSHTGAAIAVAAALAHPDRVPALVLDGYPLFTPTEQAEHMASYLTPIVPDWEGQWLAWIWSRVKDQSTFFPWLLRAQSARFAAPLSAPAAMQNVAVDFLAAGDHYRAAYASAFRFRGEAMLRQIAIPCTLLARVDDSLHFHLARLHDLPRQMRVLSLPADPAAHAAAIAEALAEGAQGSAPGLPSGGQRQEAIRVQGGIIGITRFGVGEGRPIVLIPGIPGSARGSAALARALGARRPVLCADLPGFGASTLPGGDAAAIARAIGAAVGLADPDVVACGESAAIGGLLAGEGRLVLLDPVPDSARAAVGAAIADVTPRGEGGHLLAAWHQLRDATLWRPWFARDPAHAVDAGSDPDVTRLAAILTDWMRGGTQGAATLQAALVPAIAGSLPARTAVIVAPSHPWTPELQALAPCRAVDEDVRARAAAVWQAIG